MLLSVMFLSIHLTHSKKKFIYYIYLLSTWFGIFGMMTFVIFFVDVINGFTGKNNFIKEEYQAKLNEEMSGAGDLIDLMQYLIIVSMGLYIFPIILYGAFFKRSQYFV